MSAIAHLVSLLPATPLTPVHYAALFCAGSAAMAWPDVRAQQRARRLVAVAKTWRGSPGATGPAGNLAGSTTASTGRALVSGDGPAAGQRVWLGRVAGLAVLGVVGVTGGIAAAIAGAVLIHTLVAVVTDTRGRLRQRAAAQACGQALETMTATLRAGASAPAALDYAARELAERAGDGPAGQVGRAIAHAARRAEFSDPWQQPGKPTASQSTPAAAQSATAQAWLPGELARVGRAWTIAQRHGLSLAGLLECARRDVATRLSHSSQAAAALAGPRLTIAILSALPLFGLLLGQAFGAGPWDFLLSSQLGGFVLVLGVLLVSAGIRWSVAIVAKAEAGR